MLNRESRETEERKKSIIKRVFPCALKLVRISGLMFRPFLYSSRLSFFVWQFFGLTSFPPSFVGLTLHRRKKDTFYMPIVIGAFTSPSIMCAHRLCARDFRLPVSCEFIFGPFPSGSRRPSYPVVSPKESSSSSTGVIPPHSFNSTPLRVLRILHCASLPSVLGLFKSCSAWFRSVRFSSSSCTEELHLATLRRALPDI